MKAVRLTLELGNDVDAVMEFGGYRYGDTRFNGGTALHGAANRGANSIVQVLVDEGARLDAKTEVGWTPLHIANGAYVGGTERSTLRQRRCCVG